MSEDIRKLLSDIGEGDITVTDDHKVSFDLDVVDSLTARMNEALQEKVDHSLDDLGKEIHETNVEKGFWGDPEMMDKVVAKLALVHSEVTEVLEALRKGHGADKVTEEFADILIRTLDLYSTLVEAGEADPKLFRVMHNKMQANKDRPAKHGHRWG